jgi:hypothetical protein
MNEPWYSVRCLFKHKKRADMSKKYLYEERITLWNSESMDKAIEYAEKEAEDYAKDCECEYLGMAQAYHLYDENIDNGSEIFSLMREHDSKSNNYLNLFFDTAYERQQNYKV